MTGHVDAGGRALIDVCLRHPTNSQEAAVEAWIDTGFNGHLLLSRARIAALGLPVAFGGRAQLADGSDVDLETYSGLMDWFGEQRVVEVIANDGKFPLLGVGLMLGHDLHISYRIQTVAID